jgi:hypothetical protein
MKTNKLEKLFDRLREEGWYCGWAHTCCQSCAWMDVPDYFDAKYDKDGYLIREDKDGNEIEYEEVDLSKVLFNHEQDCCIDEEDWEGDEDDYYDMLENYDGDGTMPTFTSDQITDSTFCFDGSKEGVENLKAILPIIEECDCEIHWDGTGGMRPTIRWD